MRTLVRRVVDFLSPSGVLWIALGLTLGAFEAIPPAAPVVVAVVALKAKVAKAGEMFIGTLISGAGADITNATTSTPFSLSPGDKLTLNCTAAAVVCVDTSTACAVGGTTNPGVPVAALANFPTSAAQTQLVQATVNGKPSSVIRIAGAAAVTCTVWRRNGNE